MIDVIIAVHNRRALTLRCLELLARQTLEHRVVVVDDGSADGTGRAVREQYPQATLLRGDGNLWWAGATNVGLRHVLDRAEQPRHVLLLNDDLEFGPDYLEQMVSCAGSRPRHLLGSLAVFSNDRQRVMWCGSARTPRECASGRVGRSELAGCVAAATLQGRGMLVPTGVFSEIGLLDSEQFPHYFADTDFSLRARQAGYPLGCCCDTEVAVHASATGPGSLFRRGSISTFVRSFADLRSPNYVPVLWRFQRRHGGRSTALSFSKQLARIVGGELMRRTGLRSWPGVG